MLLPSNKNEFWTSIDWVDCSKKVTGLQILIFEASKCGNLQKLHEYQNSLINMREAKLLSIRKVTQENMGKRTAGVDNVSKLNGTQRLKLMDKMKIDGKASPIRRVWLDKPGTTEKRPLGIPTILDRAKQQLVKLAVEPQWEAKFEGHSFGFRPGRSTMDAITRVWAYLQNMEKYILDADIRKCFDRIDHDVLVKKVGASYTISKQIYSWLKAGILDPDISTNPITNDRGTPQGGVISPLLSNIALHGLEEFVHSRYNSINKVPGEITYDKKYIGFVRYADDLCFFHPLFEVTLRIKGLVSEFLSGIGLELNEKKTKIRHSLKTIEYNGEKIKPGLTYLGAFFILTKSRKSPNVRIGSRTKERTFHKLRSFPSNENILSHIDDMRTIIKKFRGVSQGILIKQLAPIINGWSNYYQYIHNKDAFNYCDTKVFHMLVKWCYKRHPNLGKKKSMEKYFVRHKKVKWVFGFHDQGIYPKVLPFHRNRKTGSYSFSKVRGDYSPFDPDQVNKVERFKINDTGKKLFKRQNAVCKWCLYPFNPSDKLEIHHTLYKGHPQREYFKYIWLVHLHCHDQLHAHDFFEMDALNELKDRKNNKSP